MSLLVNKFNIIFASVLLILLGVDIAVAYYGLLPIPLLISLNLAILGFLVILRGVKEHDVGERRFYLLWGSTVAVTALSISLASFAGLVVGLASFFISLGMVILFIATRFST